MAAKKCILAVLIFVTTLGVSYRLVWRTRMYNNNNNMVSRDRDDFEDVLKPQSREFVGLVNSFKDFKRTKMSEHVKERMAEVFRTGYGRKPIKTEDGDIGWTENGILFRPIREKLALMKSHKDVQHEHQSDIEYYVPFNQTLFYQGTETLFYQGTDDSSETSVKPKIILWYYKAAHVREMPSLENLWLCPEFPCHITTNQSYSNMSDAWIMDAKLLQDDTPKRRPEQVAIFHTAGRWPRVTPQWSNQFNWTLTYRPDSDIQFTFGIIRKRQEPVVKDYATLITKKSRMAAAFISNCKSGGLRHNYTEELKKYISVDIFGKCGNDSCSHREHSKCSEMINTNYKFYFSFENSICDDYISEKLFRYFSLDVVVVVRGGDGYYRHLPPEIYINTADYESPRQLADRLIHLDQHPAEYEAILREKNKYVSVFEDWFKMDEKTNTIGRVNNFFLATSLCRICHWIWHLGEHTKIIHNINEWLGKSNCIRPTDF